MHFSALLFLLPALASVVSGHARIRRPTPLDAPAEDPSGNSYNAPLDHLGSEFPCKNLHLKTDVDRTPTQVWQAGQMGMFEILGHVVAGEGALAAHSGGSCQASLSFDNGTTWKVLHSYHGGCPRDVQLFSNMAGRNQTFAFLVPKEAKAGVALFAWTWIAVTGQRNEYYMNCASVSITGRGTSTLDSYPDMFVGDMDLPGQIGTGECRSTAGSALLFPNPGPSSRITETKVSNIPFKKPTPGKCFSPKKQDAVSGPPAKPPARVDIGDAVMTPAENIVYVEEYSCGG